MVYVADGKVYESQPWGIKKIVGLFFGIINFIIFFFKTLVGLDPQKPITGSGGGFRSGSTFRGSGGGGGGGGGGPGYGPGRPGGGGPSKRVFTMRDINPPRVGGGCPGGACGL